MAQADVSPTLIPAQVPTEITQNPIERALSTVIRKLALLQAPRVRNGKPDIGYAQELTRLALDFADIVDQIPLEIGREARLCFGRGVVLDVFTDIMRSSLEVTGLQEICEAAQEREEYDAEFKRLPYIDDRRINL